jgi:hypothetical protein
VALESLGESVNINIAWESIRDNEILGFHRLKSNKQWFDDECPK